MMHVNTLESLSMQHKVPWTPHFQKEKVYGQRTLAPKSCASQGSLAQGHVLLQRRTISRLQLADCV